MKHVTIICLHLFILLDTCKFQSTFNLVQGRYDTSTFYLLLWSFSLMITAAFSSIFSYIVFKSNNIVLVYEFNDKMFDLCKTRNLIFYCSVAVFKEIHELWCMRIFTVYYQNLYLTTCINIYNVYILTITESME